MDAAAIQRFARQIALPEIGPDGQQRLGVARVVVAGHDRAADVAALYLTAAGVGAAVGGVRRLGGPTMVLWDDSRPPAGGEPWPADGAAWRAALASAALVVRSGFDDDGMMGAVKQLGLPAVVMRGKPDTVDIISFPRRAPVEDDEPELAARAGDPANCGSSAVVAGTLAAGEAIHALLGHGPVGRARVLRVPLDGGELPQVQEMPWV